MHVHAAIVLGHEAELVGFGLHLHRSFAGQLVVALRSSYLEPTQISIMRWVFCIYSKLK